MSRIKSMSTTSIALPMVRIGKQTYLSNIELNVGGTHKTRVGECTCVYSPKGKLLKRKKAKKVKVKKDERRYTIFRADVTDSDSADEEYMCNSE